MKALYILPLLAIVLMSFARPDIIEQTEQVLVQEEAKVKELERHVQLKYCGHRGALRLPQQHPAGHTHGPSRQGEV